MREMAYCGSVAGPLRHTPSITTALTSLGLTYITRVVLGPSDWLSQGVEPVRARGQWSGGVWGELRIEWIR